MSILMTKEELLFVDDVIKFCTTTHKLMKGVTRGELYTMLQSKYPNRSDKLLGQVLAKAWEIINPPYSSHMYKYGGNVLRPEYAALVVCVSS